MYVQFLCARIHIYVKRTEINNSVSIQHTEERDDATNLLLPTLRDLFQFVVRFASARRDVFTICIMHIYINAFSEAGQWQVDAHASRWDYENKYLDVISIFRWHTFSALCIICADRKPLSSIHGLRNHRCFFCSICIWKAPMHGRVRDEPTT
jgi:hypothetical protein